MRRSVIGLFLLLAAGCWVFGHPESHEIKIHKLHFRHEPAPVDKPKVIWT
jgi:hypothetical protein